MLKNRKNAGRFLMVAKILKIISGLLPSFLGFTFPTFQVLIDLKGQRTVSPFRSIQT